MLENWKIASPHIWEAFETFEKWFKSLINSENFQLIVSAVFSDSSLTSSFAMMRFNFDLRFTLFIKMCAVIDVIIRPYEHSSSRQMFQFLVDSSFGTLCCNQI